LNFFLSSSTVERAAVNGVIVVRFHAGEPLPGSPSGRGLLSYKQKQWSSILHPGTSFCGQVVNLSADWQSAQKEKRVDNPLQDAILPHNLRAGKVAQALSPANQLQRRARQNRSG
jgi:hypothetical protein